MAKSIGYLNSQHTMRLFCSKPLPLRQNKYRNWHGLHRNYAELIGLQIMKTMYSMACRELNMLSILILMWIGHLRIFVCAVDNYPISDIGTTKL